ncbi:MAG: heme NO-binding domain-containing protein [Novosphingobium sp.]|uniref:heme NO-binding domain-containing protein n=1 Tax=Novosphingobium sp. NDB2Meth1 TaxID=1892847 RepID=UPI00092FEEC3|nr:heme NO-binding domain-containing protein [Novosphingobium sp. NDB2Meth1]MBY0393454.1 heme NO-binding domain-containing protein [Novosphingobium sp.]
MKGLVFSELMAWAEDVYSPALVDQMIVHSGVPNDGAYTSVGNYPHGEALALLGALADLTGEPVGELARAYGYWLAGRFVTLYPEMVGIYPDAESLLAGVGPHIHEEVTRLYPEAQPPRVQANPLPDGMQLEYASHRPFALLAHGLIEGFVAYFGNRHTIAREDLDPAGTAARFTILQITA